MSFSWFLGKEKRNKRGKATNHDYVDEKTEGVAAFSQEIR